MARPQRVLFGLKIDDDAEDLIRRLRDSGKCVLFSSHVMQEVAALCDEIIIIADGQVALHDTPDNIRERTGCDDLEDAFVCAIEMVTPEAVESV